MRPKTCSTGGMRTYTEAHTIENGAGGQIMWSPSGAIRTMRGS